MPLSPMQQTNLHLIADASITCEMRTSIPADLICAQCILESAWLKVAPGHNCFGIKSYLGEFGRQLLMTREWFDDHSLAWFLHLGDSRTATLVDPTLPPDSKGRRQYRCYDWFSTFPDLASCFAKRASLFQHGAYGMYATAYSQDHNFDRYARSVAQKYATAPNYADVIMSIVRMPEVVEALQDAKEAVGKRLV